LTPQKALLSDGVNQVINIRFFTWFYYNLPLFDLFLYPVLWPCDQLIAININIFIIQPETKSAASLENALAIYNKCFERFIRHAAFDPNLALVHCINYFAF